MLDMDEFIMNEAQVRFIILFQEKKNCDIFILFFEKTFMLLIILFLHRFLTFKIQIYNYIADRNEFKLFYVC